MSINHGMSADEYDGFVSDMWIGIILTMVMVLIVFALCIWYMYHKFQQWKRHYDARTRMRNNAAGLPTYDDALEQLRLSSTNHLLINHQTIMKIFGSIKDKPKKQKPDIPVPTYEDSVRPPQLHAPPQRDDDSSENLNSNQNSQLPNAKKPSNRFECTIVIPPLSNTSEQNFRTNGQQLSNHSPEISWSHRSTSLCIDLENSSNGSDHNHHHLEHRGSLY